jgi:uncharacterized protein (TIGR03086 family)
MTDHDRRSELVRSYAHAADIVRGVRPDQLGNPTPCPDYDTSALVDHLVGAGWRAAALGRGESPTADDFPHVDLSDAPDHLRRAAEDAALSWADDDRLHATVRMPWGEEYTGTILVDMYLAELAAHTWDLAAATGQLEQLDPRLAEPALEGARNMLKPEYRNLMAKGSPYGAEVAPPPDAVIWERFASFMGRPPRDWHLASQ